MALQTFAFFWFYLFLEIFGYFFSSVVCFLYKILRLKYSQNTKNNIMLIYLVPVVQRVDNFIQWISPCPVDKIGAFLILIGQRANLIHWIGIYPLDKVIRSSYNRAQFVCSVQASVTRNNVILPCFRIVTTRRSWLSSRSYQTFTSHLLRCNRLKVDVTLSINPWTARRLKMTPSSSFSDLGIEALKQSKWNLQYL